MTPIGTYGDVTSSPNADWSTFAALGFLWPFVPVPSAPAPLELPPFGEIVAVTSPFPCASPRGTRRARGSTVGAPRSRPPRCSGPRGTRRPRRDGGRRRPRPARRRSTPAGVSTRVRRRRSAVSAWRSTRPRVTSPSTTAVTLGGLTARRPASAEDALDPSPSSDSTRYWGNESSRGSRAVSTWRASRASARAAPGGTRTDSVAADAARDPLRALIVRRPHG